MNRLLVLAVVTAWCWASASCRAEFVPTKSTDDPFSEIHIGGPAEADAVRERIIRYFWADGILPLGELPVATDVELTPQLKTTLEIRVPERWVRSPSEPIDPAVVGRVEKLVAHVDFDYHAVAYLFHPAKAPTGPARLLIIHQGHQGGVMDGTGVLANRALAEGFHVLMMQMPFAGWNDAKTFHLPGGKVTIDYRGSIIDCHTRLVAATEGHGGSALRFYIEPVIVCLNHFVKHNPTRGMIAMTGLSGGGWTTDIAPAIDTRIAVSIPVAGSTPWYMSPPPPNAKHGFGDGEQGLMAMYGKTASYLDLYILAGYGKGRRRIQVFPEFDSLVVPGVKAAPTYGAALARVMKVLQAGESVVVIDKKEKIHRISPWTIDNVIMPAIRGENVPVDTPEPQRAAAE